MKQLISIGMIAACLSSKAQSYSPEADIVILVLWKNKNLS